MYICIVLSYWQQYITGSRIVINHFSIALKLLSTASTKAAAATTSESMRKGERNDQNNNNNNKSVVSPHLIAA
jgi:hypothetical protein